MTEQTLLPAIAEIRAISGSVMGGIGNLYPNYSRLADPVGLADDALNAYNDYYGDISPLNQATHLVSPGFVGFDHDVIARRDLKKSQCFAEFLDPNRLHHLSAMYVCDEHDKVVIATFCRDEKVGPYGEDERQLFKLLVPHLQQAFVLNHQLQQLQQIQAVSFQALNRLETGIVVLNDRNATVFFNRQAELLCTPNSGLRLTGTGIASESRSANAKLRAIIRESLATASGQDTLGGNTAVLPRRGMARPLVATCMPVTEESAVHMNGSPAVMIFLRDPDHDLMADTAVEILQTIYGLSPTEALVATKIANGQSVKQCAEDLGHAVSTSRNLLKRAFQKTHTRSQAELTSLLLKTLIQ